MPPGLHLGHLIFTFMLSNKRVGMKKYYVFHLGEAPDGNTTNWIMQEYRLLDSDSSSRSSKRRSQPKPVS